MVLREKAARGTTRELNAADRALKAALRKVENLERAVKNARNPQKRKEHQAKLKTARKSVTPAKATLANKKKLDTVAVEVHKGTVRAAARAKAVVARLEKCEPRPDPSVSGATTAPPEASTFAAPTPPPAAPLTAVDLETVDLQTTRAASRTRAKAAKLSLRVVSFHEFQRPLPGAWASDIGALRRDMLNFDALDLKAAYGNKGLPNQSNHCCLWCHATSDQRKKFWADICGSVQPRDDDTLKRDLDAFVASGKPKGNVSGVSCAPISTTPLERTSPGPLHTGTLAGPVDIYKLLLIESDDLDELDEAVAEALDGVARLEGAKSALEDAAEERTRCLLVAKRDLRDAKVQEDTARGKMPPEMQASNITWEGVCDRGGEQYEAEYNAWVDAWNVRVKLEGEVKEIEAEAKAAKGELAAVENELAEALKSLHGTPRPTRIKLVATLKNYGVDVTRYFGGSLAGGSACEFLKNCKDIFDEWLNGLDAAFATRMRDVYLPLLELMNVVNSLIRRAVLLTPDEMDEAEDAIGVFCDLYRVSLPGKLQATPKLHILEAHVVPFMRRWGSVGMFGEDALESMHAKVNRLMLRARQIRNKVEQQQFLLKLMDASQNPDALAAMAATAAKSKRNFTNNQETRAALRRERAAAKAAKAAAAEEAN